MKFYNGLQFVIMEITQNISATSHFQCTTEIHTSRKGSQMPLTLVEYGISSVVG